MRIVLGLILMVAIFGCSTSRKKLSPPKKTPSIVILPIINNSTAADAPQLYLSTLAEPLSNRGYYVYPIEITDKIFIQEGITSGLQLKDVPVAKYRKLFGADAVLRVTINSWDTSYAVVASNVSVELDCQLISTQTGKVIWSKSGEISVPIEAQSSGNLLVSLAEVALRAATTDYVVIARKLNQQIFSKLPAGKYHIKYREVP